MSTIQLATRVQKEQEELFREMTNRLGTTPADAMRIFIAAFNQHHGFPFDVRLATDVEPFHSEEEATDFSTRMSRKLLNETR